MNLRETILSEHSKKNCNKIVSWVGSNQQRFDQLFELFLATDYLVAQRAAWPVSECGVAHPELIRANFANLLSNLLQPGLHDAVKRNTMRLLYKVEILEEFDGTVMQICFDYLASPLEAVAVKAFSLGILERLAKKYPEIVPEVKLLIEDQISHQRPAFKSRAKKFLAGSKKL